MPPGAGPVIAHRVFHLFAKVGGLSRIYEATRRRFIVGLRAALDERVRAMPVP